MKKIDIEKWERNNPKLPNDFFAEMQQKVLAETTQKQEPKRISLKWVWAAAAVLAMMFGLTFLTNLDNEKFQNKVIASLQIEEYTEVEPNLIAQNEVNNIAYQPISHPKKKSKSSFATQKTETSPKKEIKTLATNVQMEELLNSMTENELEDLAMNYEQDIYFDLY